MTDEVHAAQDADDAKLLNLVRAGDTGVFEVLRQRHEHAARRLASELAGSAADVDDLVAQTFAQVLSVTSIGGGPSDAFRPYLLTALRLACDSGAAEGSGVPEEKSLMAAAFFALPERWIAVLWHTDIESANPAEVATLLGLSTDGVAALRRRAREGLRQSYLHLHASRLDRPECRPVAEQLGAFVRDPSPGPESALVTEHLSQCDDCRAVYAELADVNVALRTMVAPVILGRAAAAYLSGVAHEPAAAGAMVAVRGGIAGIAARRPRAGSGHAARFSASAARRSLRPSRLLAAAAVIAVCGAGFAISLAGHHTPLAPPHHSPAAATPQPNGVVELTPSQRASSHAPVASSRTPTGAPSSPAMPPGSAAPPLATSPGSTGTASSPSSAAAALTASVSIGGQHPHSAKIGFQINDTGSAATGELTVSITLPAGTSLSSGNSNGHGHDSAAAGGSGGWSCQPTSAGASCQHSAISPGGHAQGVIFIGISGSAACGQSVGLTVTSGSATASAQSPQNIQCSSDNQD